MVPKVTGWQIEKMCGSSLAGRIQCLARSGGGLAKTFHDVVVAGVEALEAKRVEPDPVATQPIGPRGSHITL